MRRLLAGLVLLATLGSAGRERMPALASARFTLSALPLLPGSVVPVDVDGLTPPYGLDLLGPGRIVAGLYQAPRTRPKGNSAMLVAANASGFAARRIEFTAPPDTSQSFIAVASYDDGIVLHDAKPPFRIRGVFGIGGAAADVALDPAGQLAGATTDGNVAAIASLAPWRVRVYRQVPLADELAFDPSTHALFITNRDVDGLGAITKISAGGAMLHRPLGLTAEGLAIDPARHRVYVANVNDGTISVVDSRTLVERFRFHAVARVFSLALSPDGRRLYAVSNQSSTSPYAAPGRVVAIDLSRTTARVVASSSALTFPVGVALGERGKRVFVTDEHDDAVDVLSAATLHPVRAPLKTCRTPWKPLVDRGRLYVPCARANAIDVFDLATLRRVPGAPFATGGYPLAVAVWHRPSNAKR